MALKNAINELRSSSKKNDWSREISDLAEQNHKLNNEVRLCQETIDRIHVLYKESEQKVREFIRNTMRYVFYTPISYGEKRFWGAIFRPRPLAPQPPYFSLAFGQ